MCLCSGSFLCYLHCFVLVSRKFHGNWEKNAVGLIIACYHVPRGCNARPSDRIVETSGERVGRPLDRAAKGAPTPREATMTRRTSRAQLVARPSPPRHHGKSWRFRVDLGYVGESALSIGRIELLLCTACFATSHGLRMTLDMTFIYPVQCRVVTRRTRPTRFASPKFYDDAGFYRDTGENIFCCSFGLEKHP